MCSSVISVTPFSFAQATHPFKTVGRKTRGTLTSFAHASSVNLMSGSMRSAAYITLWTVVERIGSSSGMAPATFPGAGKRVYQKFLESR